MILLMLSEANIGMLLIMYMHTHLEMAILSVPNYGTPGRGVRLLPGMTIAIEPMINEGTFEVRVLDDKWTTVTKDDKLSAHFEHTVAITPDGPKIMTLCD